MEKMLSITLTTAQLSKMLEQHLNDNVLSDDVVVTNVKVINDPAGQQTFEVEFNQENNE